MNYVDLVIVKQNGGVYVFTAPAWSHLEEGDRVVVDTKYGRQEGIVFGSITTSEDLNEPEAQLIMRLLQATTPIKHVLARVVEKEFQYDDDLNEVAKAITNE